MTDYVVRDTQLTSVADAIRAKGGTSAPMAFPDGFVDALRKKYGLTMEMTKDDVMQAFFAQAVSV